MADSPTERDVRQVSEAAALPPAIPVRNIVPPLPELSDNSRPPFLPDSVSLPSDQIVIDPAIHDESTESDVPPIVAALTSAATVSFFSSATFHLLAIGTVIVISPYLGLDWLKLEDAPERPLSAALGEEEIEGDLPAFEFAGDITDQLETPAVSIEQLTRALQISDAASLMSSHDDVLKNVIGSDAKEPDPEGAGILLKVPESGLAVTKGSFTAFTIPANPKPREVYQIVIEVRLPDDVKKFKVNDLVGEVRGSDGYSQKIPYDRDTPYASGYPAENKRIMVLESSTVLDVINNRVQIIVKVPGAARLVKDEIRIRSRKLKEEQELTLVFGIPNATPDDNASNKSDQ